jgi:glutamyl-tRNA reductase
VTGRLVVVGVSHRTASLELRECLARVPEWSFSEPTAVLATCNRLELYAWSDGPSTARRLKAELVRQAGAVGNEVGEVTYIHRGSRAVSHLIRVTSGLDSVAVGEEQIHGQVRLALRTAEQRGIPSPLRLLLSTALQASRRLRKDSVPRSSRGSLAAAAIDWTLGPAKPAERRIALVLGAGGVARSAATDLLKRGFRVTVLSRSYERSAALADALGKSVRAGTLSELPERLPMADLLVGATASQSSVVDRQTMAQAVAKRGCPLTILDLALPRDVDPTVRDLAGVRLVDLHDLEELSTPEPPALDAVLAAEVRAVERKLAQVAAGPAVADLRTRAEELRLAEVARHTRRLGALSGDQAAALEDLTRALVAKLIHAPTVAVRNARRAEDVQALTRPLRKPS